MRHFRYMFQSSHSPANAPLPPPPSKYVSKNSVMRMNYVQPRQQTHVSNTQRRRSCRCCQKDTATHTNDDNTGEDVLGGVDHYNPDVNVTPDNELGGTYDPNAGAGATQQCHTDSSSCIGQGVSGCILIDNSNICCTDGGDGSGCTDIEKACMIDTKGKELCGRTIQGCSGEPPPSSYWEDAYFFSGGISGAYAQNNIGSNETLLTNNLPNGSDSSCGESDKITFSACVTGIGTSDDCSGVPASSCYGITHTGKSTTSGYYSNENSMCSSSEFISLVNPGDDGKVAAIEHGPFGTPLTGVLCSTKRWDKSLSDYNCTNTPYTNNCPIFDEITRQLHSITTNCGKNKYTFTHTNPNGTRSCLIYAKHIYNIWPKTFFEDGGNPITTAGLNDISAGVAISWGHGVLDGGCGAITFMQQGKKRGSMHHDNPGHTNLHLQIGTRAWSGEWSDSALVDSGVVKEWGNQSGYLRAGSNTVDAEANSQSCLQPIITRVELKDFKALLNTICSDICGNCGLIGCCTPGGNATNSACYGVGKADCLARATQEACSDPNDTWCCKWTDGTGPGGTITQACPSGNHIEQTGGFKGDYSSGTCCCEQGNGTGFWATTCNQACGCSSDCHTHTCIL